MAVAVAVLVFIDIVVLCIYTIIEGVYGNLSAHRVPNEENLQSEIGVSIRLYDQPNYMYGLCDYFFSLQELYIDITSTFVIL